MTAWKPKRWYGPQRKLREYAHTNKKLTPEILSAVSALRDPGQLADTILPLLKIEYPKKQEALSWPIPGQRLEKGLRSS